jgi:hypothetical protein
MAVLKSSAAKRWINSKFSLDFKGKKTRNKWYNRNSKYGGGTYMNLLVEVLISVIGILAAIGIRSQMD